MFQDRHSLQPLKLSFSLSEEKRDSRSVIPDFRSLDKVMHCNHFFPRSWLQDIKQIFRAISLVLIMMSSMKLFFTGTFNRVQRLRILKMEDWSNIMSLVMSRVETNVSNTWLVKIYVWNYPAKLLLTFSAV